MAEQKQQQLQINVPQDKATGVFSNIALVAHMPTEFVIDFAQIMPNQGQQANIVSRIILTPSHAKKLLYALQDNVNKYEKQFGEISVNGGNNRPVPGSTYPLSFGGGEA